MCEWAQPGCFPLTPSRALAERYAQIEHENRILLSKMSDIVAGGGSVDHKSEAVEYSHSLNREARRRELQRITEENLVHLTCDVVGDSLCSMCV